MVHRRGFIQSGLAIGGAAVLPQVARAAAPLQLHGFVFDSRFAEAGEIAGAACSAPRWATAGDMMPLWYERLDLQWKEKPLPLAGVTTADALFVMETLAADYRMRVVYRGMHSAPQGGLVQHELSGPEALVREAGAGGPGWAARLGRVMTSATAGQSARREVAFATATTGAKARETTLYSWIIAPREMLSAA